MKHLCTIAFCLIGLTLFSQGSNETLNRNWVRSPINNTSDKIALVIGNSAYYHNNQLVEPANDANTIAEALKLQGYEVVLGFNLDRYKFLEAIADFAKRVPRAKECTIFFAGHGFQVQGENYLVPTDANPQNASQVNSSCINVRKDLLDQIAYADIPKLIMVDACRNNPFLAQWTGVDRSNLTPGMSEIDGLRNAIVLFSTAENTVVSDSNPFAEIFAEEIEEGGCLEGDIIRRVSRRILAANRNQLISPRGLLDKPICFNTKEACPFRNEGLIWSPGNLDINVPESSCYPPYDCNKQYGRLYTQAAGKLACSRLGVGWRLPTRAEWKTLFASYGGYREKDDNDNYPPSLVVGQPLKAANALLSGGSSGFDAQLGGMIPSPGAKGESINTGGTYLSSEKHPNLQGQAYHVNFSRDAVSLSWGGETAMRSCRCVKSVATAPGMVLVSGGMFQMGNTFTDEQEQKNELPVHPVRLDDFYISAYNVTFDEYDAYCAATASQKPRDFGWGRGLQPIVDVSWYDAIKYCNWLSQEHGYCPVYEIKGEDVSWDATTDGYRLPTEAEWEFAARERGQKVRFGDGSNTGLANNLNFNGELNPQPYSSGSLNRERTLPAGSLKNANSLGLYDMSGNVWEWCWDWYDENYYGMSIGSFNPKGPDSGEKRVVRGGSFLDGAASARCTNRAAANPSPDFSSKGRKTGSFRLARNTN